MKTSKRILSLLLTIVMMLSIVPLATVQSSAINESQVKTKLDAFMKSYPSGSRWTGSFDGGSQCYGFGKLAVYNVFGKNSSGGYRSWSYAGVSTSGMKTIGSITNYSAANVKSLLSNAKCGDILQFNTTKQHTMIVYSVDSNGVTIYDCNWDNNCGISKRYCSFGTWSGRNSSKLTLLRADNYETVHVHSYTTHYEGDHPHKVYKKCSCGDWYYTGETVAHASCSTCMKKSGKYPITPLKAYTLNTGKTTVYTTVNTISGSAKTNKIYDTDLCTISEFYDCGWCKVTFPLDSGGTETGYVKTSTFINTACDVTTAVANKQLTTYSRSNLSTSIGYAGAGDKIHVIAFTSTAVQIAYPLTSGGYKAGWVPISAFTYTIAYNANGGSGSMANTSAKYRNTLKLSANKFTRTGYTFSGWNVYRSSDQKWYTSSYGWKTANEISANGYAKSVYRDELSCVLDKSWIGGGKTNDTLTFYAVWNPNTYTIAYNANGGTGTTPNSSHTYDVAKALTANGFTRTGYTFLGWSTSASATTATYTNKQSVKNLTATNGGTVTLYAVWQKNPSTVSSISIQSKPTKTVYTVGEKFDASGLAVKVTMSDGTTKTITSGFTVSNPDMSTAGTKTVTVTYSGKTASFTITVNNPPATVSSIAIQSKPTKTVYTVGEKFDASGLKIQVTMSDGTTKTITSGFTLSNPDMSKAGTKSVTVTYSGKTASFTITVNNPPAIVSSIAIQSKPTKTVYTVGEKFDASGLKIKVTMSDGTTKTITSGFTLTNPDMSKAGTKSVTVTYSGKTASFTITVNNPPATVSSIAIQSKPTKTVYTVGEKFDASGLKIKVTMSDGTTKTITSGFTLTNPDMSKAGTKSVTVTYSGKTASFTITVNNPPATVSSVSIQSKPTKTVYTVGEKFDASGLKVKVTMSDGTTKTITSGFTLSNPDMSKAGTKSVTVTYSGKTVSFTITVKDANPPENTGALRLITPASARVGQRVQIPVQLDKASLGTLTFTVKYDHTKLKYVSCTESTFDMCDVYAGNTGVIRAACIDNDAVSAGRLAVLTFEVIAPSACLTDLTLVVEEAYDGSDKAVSVTGGTWELSVVKTVLGDLNGDGQVTAIDARWALQAASGTRTLNEEQKAAADINGDGKITAIDARWILQAASGTRVL